MNERIKDLESQCWEERKYGPPWFDSEKFAELIVRECANAAYQSLYEDRIFDDNPYNIRIKVMDDIKKHFGVDE